jgi:hypothetical protein
MSHVEQPVYLVAWGDRWATFPNAKPKHAVPAFGTEEDARRYVRRIAKRDGLPAAAFRVVVYEFSGKVLEG